MSYATLSICFEAHQRKFRCHRKLKVYNAWFTCQLKLSSKSHITHLVSLLANHFLRLFWHNHSPHCYLKAVTINQETPFSHPTPPRLPPNEFLLFFFSSLLRWIHLLSCWVLCPFKVCTVVTRAIAGNTRHGCKNAKPETKRYSRNHKEAKDRED